MEENEAIITRSGVSPVAAGSMSHTPVDVSVKIESLETKSTETNDPERFFGANIRTSIGSTMGQSQLQVKLTRLPTHLLNTYIKKAKNICSDGRTGSPADSELILKKTSKIQQTVKSVPADKYNSRKNTKENEYRTKNYESKPDVSTKISNDVAKLKYNTNEQNSTNNDSLLDIHSCIQCNYKTYITGDYIHHLEAHSATIKFTCDICSYIGIDKQSIIYHLKTHTREKPYSCGICNEKFERHILLINHKSTHTNENIGANVEKTIDTNYSRNPLDTLLCSTCNYQANSTRHYILHLKAHSAPKKYICDTCSYICVYKCTLIKHLRIHATKAYACQICDKKFSREYYIKTHIRTHTGEKPYECPICDKKFAQNSHVRSHIKLHTGEKSHACSICNKTFGRRYLLTNHIRTHTNEKPFACSVCDKKFSQSKHLKDHFRSHSVYILVQGKEFACDICDKLFQRNDKLKQHLKIHSREKPYSCEHCDKKFSRNDHMKGHVNKVHFGEQPYACNVCNQKFRRRYMLAVHNRTHNPKFSHKIPYCCKRCDREFINLGNFNKHIRQCKHTAKP